MGYDLYPAVDEDYLFAPAVREANAATPEFRNQVVPMTETQRNNLTGDDLWTNRMIFNTTTTRINRYTGSGWTDLSSEAPGIVKMFAGASAPAGHVLCNGAVVSRTGIYSALFAIIGTTYNTTGESSTEFRLPNLKGKVVVGVDAGQAEFNVLGETGGEKTHTLTEAETPAHDHAGNTQDDTPDHGHGTDTTSDAGVHAHQTYLGDAAYSNTGGSTTKSYSATPGDGTTANGLHNHSVTVGGADARHHHPFTTDSAGGNGAHNNLQPYIAMNYIITL